MAWLPPALSVVFKLACIWLAVSFPAPFTRKVQTTSQRAALPAHVILQIVVLLFRMVGQKCLDRVIVLDAAIGFHIEHTLVLFLKQGPIWRIPVRAEGVQPFDEAPVGLVPGVIVISAGVFGAEFLRQGSPVTAS